MSDVGKYKEDGCAKALRLSLGKPHIFWDSRSCQWLSAPGGDISCDTLSTDFCIEQDKRWTPVQKD